MATEGFRGAAEWLPGVACGNPKRLKSQDGSIALWPGTLRSVTSLILSMSPVPPPSQGQSLHVRHVYRVL